MVDIAASRQTVTDGLTEVLQGQGVNIYPQPPDRPAFPAVVLHEADTDFITPGDLYGQCEISWNAVLFCEPSTSNKVMTAQADALVSVILNQLAPLRPTIQTYATATLAGQSYLVAAITLTHTTTT